MIMIPYEQALLTLIESDARILVLTAENRGHLRSLPEKIGDRFLDVGIAEQTMIGAAAGLALRGRIVLTHALAAFITLRAFEFIRDDVGIPGLPVIMVGMVPGILSDGNGPTHQAIDDVHLMRGIPNVNVFCPADEVELVAGLPVIVRSGQPWYVRYNASPAAVDHPVPFEVGKAETVIDAQSDQRIVTILTYGVMLRQAVEAAHVLNVAGRAVRVVNLRTLKPIDRDAILDACSTSELVVTLEDHFHVGGLHTIVAELLLEHRRTANVLAIDLGSTWFTPARLPDVLSTHGLTGEAIARRILQHPSNDPIETYAQHSIA